MGVPPCVSVVWCLDASWLHVFLKDLRWQAPEEHDRKDLGMISNGLCRLQKYGDTTCNSHLNWRIMINLKIGGWFWGIFSLFSKRSGSWGGCGSWSFTPAHSRLLAGLVAGRCCCSSPDRFGGGKNEPANVWFFPWEHGWLAPVMNHKPFFQMGLSENVGFIFPMIASHFSKRDNWSAKPLGTMVVHNIFRHTQDDEHGWTMVNHGEPAAIFRDCCRWCLASALFRQLLLGPAAQSMSVDVGRSRGLRCPVRPGWDADVAPFSQMVGTCR